MKNEFLLLIAILSFSVLNCKTDNDQNVVGVHPVAPQVQEYPVKFKVPNAPLDSTVYFQLNNDDTNKFYLDSSRSVVFPIDVMDKIQLIDDSIKTALTISDGLDVLRQLHIWLYDQTNISNCDTIKGIRELRGIFKTNSEYPISAIRVTNMSTSIYKSVQPNTAGIYKMCFGGTNLQYKYALDNQSKKIEMDLTVFNDPDTRIDVYLTDDDAPIIPIK